MKRLVEQVLGESVSGAEPTALQVNAVLDVMHQAMYPDDSVPQDFNASEASYAKVMNVFAMLAKANDARSVIESLVGSDPEGKVSGGATFVLNKAGVPVGLKETNSDLSLLLEVGDNLDDLREYVDRKMDEQFSMDAVTETVTPPRGLPTVTSPTLEPRTSASGFVDGSVFEPDTDRRSVVPDEDPIIRPASTEREVAVDLFKFFREIGVIDEETKIPGQDKALTGQIDNVGIKFISNPDSNPESDPLVFISELRGIKESSRYKELKKAFEEDGENFSFAQEDLDNYHCCFSDEVMKNPYQFFQIVDNTEKFLRYENAITPLSFKERGMVIQKAVNVLGEVLNRQGYDIDRPIDRASADEDGVDGALGPLSNWGVQELTPVLNFLATGRAGGQIYTPEMGEKWLEVGLHNIFAGFDMSKQERDALLDAMYIVRANGEKEYITQQMIVDALDAYAEPPKEGEPEYDDYVRATTNPSGGNPYGLYKEVDPRAKVRLVPLKGPHLQTVKWLQGDEDLLDKLPNGQPFMDELVRSYTGMGLSSLSPDFTPKYQDGTEYKPDFNDSNIARMQAQFQKMMEGTPPPKFSDIEFFLLAAAGGIGDLPFGEYEDKKAFVDAVKLSLENAEKYKDDPARAAEAFANTFSLEFTNMPGFDLKPKSYPPGEIPMSPALRNFKIGRTDITPVNVLESYMEQNEQRRAGGWPDAPIFFGNHVGGVGPHGGFMVVQVEQAALDALKDGSISSLDELKTALGSNTAAYESFVKAHELASRYNIDGINYLAGCLNANTKFQAAQTYVWADSDATKRAQENIEKKLKELEDEQEKKIAAKLSDEERARIVAGYDKQFDDAIKAEYKMVLASDDPAYKKAQRQLKKALKKYGDIDAANLDATIDKAIVDMRAKPDKNKQFHENLKAHHKAHEMDIELALVAYMSSPRYYADVERELGVYRGSAEYIAAREQIVGELAVNCMPWIDEHNVNIGDAGTLSQEYDINDIVNAYNAQKPEQPLFFKDEAGQTYIFHVLNNGIATIDKIDGEAIKRKYRDYQAAYSMSDEQPSALKELREKSQEAYDKWQAALKTHNETEEFMMGRSHIEGDRAAEKRFDDSWTNVMKLQYAYEESNVAVRNARKEGERKVAHKLQEDFPIMASIMAKYPDMNPLDIARNATYAKPFGGNGGIEQPTGHTMLAANASSSSPGLGGGASFSASGSRSGGTYVAGSANGVRRPIVFSGGITPPVETGDKRTDYRANRKFKEDTHEMKFNPVRQDLNGRNYLCVYLSDTYKSKLTKEIEALETAHASETHTVDGKTKTLSEWRLALKTHQDNVKSGAGNTDEEKALVAEAEEAIAALEDKIGTGALHDILNNSGDTPYVKIDVTDEVAFIEGGGEASHADTPALWHIARQYGPRNPSYGSAELVYNKMFDPPKGVKTPTYDADFNYEMVESNENIAATGEMTKRMRDIVTREPRSQKKPWQFQKENRRAARYHRRDMQDARQAQRKRDDLDKLDLELAEMHENVKEMLEDASHGEMLTASDQLYIQEFKGKCDEYNRLKAELEDFAIAKSKKSRGRDSRLADLKTEMRQTADDVSGKSLKERQELYAQIGGPVDGTKTPTSPSGGGAST